MGRGAVLARFVADPPTVTMQRVKGLMTGGLPTFIDLSRSFSAAAVTEDSLVAQLRLTGRRLAFMGDDTWLQLFPTAFEWARPFPSFNVHDLHTVDDGIWEELLPALRNPQDWDVLVVHYLGVDHAGHSHGTRGPAMTAKLRQLDAQIRQAVDAVAAEAGEGGQHARTLITVLGDHGQTAGGEHGGGTPVETDTVLLALSAATLHRRRAMPVEPIGTADGGSSSQCTRDLAPVVTMPQVDFAASMALLLGVPIPFGSIGRLSRTLWLLSDQPEADATFRAALSVNAWQVHHYLNEYAAAGAALPRKLLARSNALFAATLAAAAGSSEQERRELSGGSCGACGEFNGGRASAAGVLWALLGTHLFFCTGHFCEFAGLQTAAGFVGAALAFGLLRALAAGAAMLSAAIQRRHLMVWALFAPKFVFEAAFLLVSDAALVAAGFAC
ncbi:hypothetical protein WJX81_004970 [Elliptochloris bilobata]|uniref:GPI ethanolamine phosphate transferase 3 n=1 Tax=Elliptochloris bilobata TaxID=381761 RepID=A0AAW1RHH3_9CHLO